jgi:hypothetical protein
VCGHAPFFGLKFEDAAVGGIIVHDQDAFVLQGGLDALDIAGGPAFGNFGRFGPDGEDELRAFANAWLSARIAAAHHLGQALADGEAQTRAAKPAGGGGIGL